MRAQTERPLYQIPFSFKAEGVELSSGKYILSSGTGAQTGMLRGENGKGVLFIISGTLSGNDRSALISTETDTFFDRYGMGIRAVR